MAGVLKAGVQFGAALAQRRDGALGLFFPFADVGIYFLLMGKIEGNCAIHLLQSEGREVLKDELESRFERYLK